MIRRPDDLCCWHPGVGVRVGGVGDRVCDGVLYQYKI